MLLLSINAHFRSPLDKKQTNKQTFHLVHQSHKISYPTRGGGYQISVLTHRIPTLNFEQYEHLTPPPQNWYRYQLLVTNFQKKGIPTLHIAIDTNPW